MGARPFNQALLSAGLGAAALAAAYFAAPFEGQKYVAYRDGGGIWTICRGHTKGVHKGMTATQDQCDAWFAEDIAEAEKVYGKFVQREMPRNVKVSAIDFIFNTGPGNFRTSTLRRKLNVGDRVGACNQYPRWKYQGPTDCSKPVNVKICGGLWVRRLQEKTLCLDDTQYSSFVMRADGTIAGIR